MVRHRLLADEYLTLAKQKVKARDWVVYLHSIEETAMYGSIHKYTAPLGAPDNITEIGEEWCKVAEWHSKNEGQVLLTLIR